MYALTNTHIVSVKSDLNGLKKKIFFLHVFAQNTKKSKIKMYKPSLYRTTLEFLQSKNLKN